MGRAQKLRQELSRTPKNDGDKNSQRKALVLLESTEELPYIFKDSPGEALAFAKTAHSSEEQFVLFVDGSKKNRSISPVSLPSSGGSSPSSNSSLSSSNSSLPSYPPSENPSPASSRRSSSDSSASSSTRRSDCGASVCYREGNKEWEPLGFGLPGVESSLEAELCAIDQGLNLALERASNNTLRGKVIIFTDCLQAMRSLAEHLKGTVSPTKRLQAAEAASHKACELRRLQREVEIRWVKSHLGAKFGAPGAQVADRIAQNASAYTSHISDARVQELAGQALKMENPYDRKPPTDL